jgi:hypothetical protein
MKCYLVLVVLLFGTPCPYDVEVTDELLAHIALVDWHWLADSYSIL